MCVGLWCLFCVSALHVQQVKLLDSMASVIRGEMSGDLF